MSDLPDSEFEKNGSVTKTTPGLLPPLKEGEKHATDITELADQDSHIAKRASDRAQDTIRERARSTGK